MKSKPTSLIKEGTRADPGSDTAGQIYRLTAGGGEKKTKTCASARVARLSEERGSFNGRH